MKSNQKYLAPVAAGLAFLASYGFFQFAYPYHIMRREQMNLFLFDWDYIRQTYTGVGWLARFVSDFIDQFFLLPVVGPVVVALLVTAIAVCAYRICRHFLGKWPSLAVGAAFFLWSFFRETDNLYLTRYTVATLLFLVLILIALKFRKAWMKAAAAVLLLALGAWSLGSPVHKYYGRAWGWPKFEYDKIIGLDTEIYRENWDKVIKRSKDDLKMTEASYCYNLAHAMKGDLPENLFEYSQNYANSIFLWITTDLSQFSASMAGEAWFHLGEMTLAEQSAMIALQASPKHTGARYIERLARVNLATGEKGASQKYLEILSKTLFYGKWARNILNGHPDEATRAWVEDTHSKLSNPETDYVYGNNLLRPVLTGLLDANPSNALAREYLLVYDLMTFDLDHFMEDYSPETDTAPIFQEAVTVWLSMNEGLNAENAAKYGISTSMLNRLERFSRYPDNYRNTYWYYCMRAMNRL